MTVLKEGAQFATMGWLMGAMTVVFMGIMTAWIVYTWWPSRHDLLDRVSRFPLED